MAALGNILPVGDSITVGTFGSDDGSYRDFLFPALTAAGHTFTQLAMHATSGWTVNDAITGLADRITTDSADLLLVYLGVNDIRNDGRTAAQVAADMNTLITTARTANPNIDIILAEIAPAISTETANNLVIVDYNAELVTLAAGLDGAVRTITADCYTGFTDGMLVDTVHPNDFGDEHISDGFLVGIGALTGEPVPTTTWGSFSNVASSGGTASVWGEWSAWALGEGAQYFTDAFESLAVGTDLNTDANWWALSTQIEAFTGNGIPRIDNHNDHSDGTKVVDMSDGGDAYCIYQSQVGSDDGYAEVDVFIDTGMHNNHAGPIFRGSSATFDSSFDGYGAFLYNPDLDVNEHYLGIFRIDNGVPTLLVTTGDLTATFWQYDAVAIRLEVSGSTLTAYLGGEQQLSTTDATHSAGQYTGFRLYRSEASISSQPFVDNWTGEGTAATGQTVTLGQASESDTAGALTAGVAMTVPPRLFLRRS